MKNKGFTLIELMIVVVIIGVLAAVGIPSYQESVKKSKRAQSAVALLAFAGAMERHYTETDSYTGAAGSAATPTDTGNPRIFNATAPIDGGAAIYNLTISASSSSSYTLTATRTGTMIDDDCGNFTLTNTGVKSVTNNQNGKTKETCWKK